MSGALQGYEDYEPTEETIDEEFDEIEWLFHSTPYHMPIVLHNPDCVYYADTDAECDCTPRTLIRGAKA